MKQTRKMPWLRVVIGLVTLPLLSTSCVDIAQRAIINGLFYSTTPLLDAQIEECLTQAWAEDEAP